MLRTFPAPGLCATPATARHCRLPEALSTTAISGCKSSESEMTGNNRASRQSMAIASCCTLWRGFRREAAQRNRHSQSAPSVTPSHTKLRIVSIASSFRGSRTRPGLMVPAGDKILSTVYNASLSTGKWSCPRFKQDAILCCEGSGDSLRARAA
jgi:hypothetical protein